MPDRCLRRLAVVVVLFLPSTAGGGEGEDLFEAEIRPYLAERCYACHASSGRHEHELAVDWAGGLRAGGLSGPAVVPGRPGESLILAALRQEEGLAMPKGGPPPPAAVVAAFARWIELGAPDPRGTPPSAADLARETSWEATFARRSRWWSLQPIRRPDVPRVEPAADHPIDAFVRCRLAAAGLTPAPPADRVTLIRRLAFDLVGLPPEPDEIDEFVADTAADAYERLVDRMLASPRYGERWGRHWLDAVRYTESQGFEFDHPRPNAWHYRDYVIESLNADLPYDRFMREQIAGDVIEPVTTAGIVATSMLVCGAWDQAGSSQSNATQRALTREEEMEDLVSVVGQTFLGLTLNCARCHAHKFDPVAQEEYFQIRAVFDGVKHGERPVAARLDDAARAERLARLEAELAAARAAADRHADAATPQARGERAAAVATAESLERAIAFTRTPPVSYVGKREQPAPTRVLARGDVTAPGPVVAPRGLAAIATLPADLGLAPDAPEGARRLAFAAWLVDPRHPLPARVIVNRVWQLHFGRGIVATPNDFGASGALPTHPELLDWLAAEFVERGWSLKALHRLIVTSATYRQSSAATPAGLEADAENTLLWRFAPRRLEAEAVRDALLAVSGRLDLRTGGPSFRPFTTSAHGATFYHLSDRDDPAWNRRTVYRMNVNSGKEPLLDALDCPDPAVKTPRRGVTITPLQALSLMNAPFVQRQAAGLAARARAVAGDDPAAGVAAAYRIALGRPATPPEVVAAIADGRDLERVCWALLNATEFVHVR